MYYNGTRLGAFALCCFLSLSLFAKDIKTINAQGLQKPLSFIENKGQVMGQDKNPRNDIQFKLSTPGMSLYIGNGQLHYQFVNVKPNKATPDISCYQMDVTLLGANTGAEVVSADQQAYYENYFLPGAGNEALTVHSFNKIIYKNVYPGIDWLLYVKNNKVEYDFVLHPGADIHNIKLQYDGATALSMTKDGGITAETPMGNVNEKSPYAYETESGKAVASRFVVRDNIVSFEAGAHSGSLTIDPYLQWSTYFGGSAEDVATSVKVTTSGITFVGGYTSSASLGVGSVFRFSYIGGAYDGFVAKYNAAGSLIFTTYFGGPGSDKITGIALDNTGAGNPNIYLAGTTTASMAIFPGPVVTYHALNDGFVAKMNNAGSSLNWHTYYGGTNDDNINAITCDLSNNVYITGQTASLTGIATGGSYQAAIKGINDAFAAKISGATGAVIWGTYYGGTAQEEGFGIACDASFPNPNVFITGQTNSVINIATPGAHQPLLAGTNDAFVAEINNTGTSLVWGTYLGGPDLPGLPGTEQGNGIAYDPVTNNLAVVGNTTSHSGIATPTAHQPVYGGGVQDAFVSYFNPSGSLLWSTYFGGNSLDYGQGVCIDNFSNIILTGGTFSNTGIASSFASQGTIAGDYDAYLVKLNSNGQRLWSTYFGGIFYDYANAVACDNNNQLSIAGYTTSAPLFGIYGTGGLATAGTAVTSFMGGTYDGFVSKFKKDTILQIDQPFYDTLVCAGGTLAVHYTTNDFFQLTNTFTVQLSDFTGSFAAPVNIGSVTSNTSGTILCTIPPGTVIHRGYRIRIVASNPGFISPDDIYDINIISTLPATTASGTTPACVNNPISLDDNAPHKIDAYSWNGPGGSGFGGFGFTSTSKNPVNNGFSGSGATKADSGIYYVTTSHNGCPDLTASVNIVVNDLTPPIPLVSTGATNCAGSSIYLYGNPDTIATGITYSWIGPAGFTSTAQNPVIPNADFSNSGTYFLSDVIGGCPSAAASVTVTVGDTTSVSVSITVAPEDTICKGTLVDFKAIPVNGGVSTHYQWMSGPGTPIVGAMSDVFSTSTLIDGETIYCVMNSSILCPSPVNAISNVVTMNVISNPPVVQIFSGNNHVKTGDSIKFTSVIYNGGTNPAYQWKKNGRNITGANSDTYVLHNVTGRDTITLLLTSTMACAIPNYGTSNTIIAETNVGIATTTPASFYNIELFPNPNNGSFTLTGDCYSMNSNRVSVDVLNAIGQVVHSDYSDVQNNRLEKTLTLKNIPGGVYLLRISNGRQTKVLRFTVTN